MNRFRASLVTVTMLVGALAMAPAADAATILVFGQTGTANTITAVNNGAGSTTISGTDVQVIITAIEGGDPTFAYLDFMATSTGAATTNVGNIDQNYSGSFSICSTQVGCTLNYLTGAFSDLASGSNAGFQLTLGASTPSDMVNFSSDVITTLGLDRSLSFGFTNLSNPLTIVNGSIGSFTASVAGNMSADINAQVPEPMSLLLLGTGLLAAGRRRFTRKSV